MSDLGKKRVKRSNPNTSAVQFVISTMNGERLPDAVFEKLDKYVQKGIDESKVRLVCATVRV